MEIQFDHMREIVQRDNISWSWIDYITATDHKFGPSYDKRCQDDLDDRELDMHRLLQSHLDDFPVEQYFLYIPKPPRSWTKEDEGDSPTAESDPERGPWQAYSLDAQEESEEVREFWMDYAKKHVVK